MEADLARHYHLDYRDRWRHDDHDRPLLTLRRLNALLRALPPHDSAVAAALNRQPIPSRAEVLLAEIWSLWADKGVEHPLLKELRNRPRPVSTERASALTAARRRARERRRAIEAGDIT